MFSGVILKKKKKGNIKYISIKYLYKVIRRKIRKFGVDIVELLGAVGSQESSVIRIEIDG